MNSLSLALSFSSAVPQASLPLLVEKTKKEKGNYLGQWTDAKHLYAVHLFFFEESYQAFLCKQEQCIPIDPKRITFNLTGQSFVEKINQTALASLHLSLIDSSLPSLVLSFPFSPPELGFFVDREEELKKLHACVGAKQPIVLTPMRGVLCRIGKTSLLKKYAALAKDGKQFERILWFNATNEQTIQANY